MLLAASVLKFCKPGNSFTRSEVKASGVRELEAEVGDHNMGLSLKLCTVLGNWRHQVLEEVCHLT